MIGVFQQDCALFRTGLRLWEHALGHVHHLLMSVAHAYFVFFEPLPDPTLKSVGRGTVNGEGEAERVDPFLPT